MPLSRATAKVRVCICQHGQHLSRPGAAPAQSSLSCHLLGRPLIKQPLPPPPHYSMTIHQLLFSSYASGWASLENRAQCSKPGKETLKISQCWYMDVRQTKGWISVFKFCQPRLKHLFRRTNYRSEDMHFHRQPSSGRSLQESLGDPLGL